MKTVEELYEKIAVLQTRALELHYERYKTYGTYDTAKCRYQVEDIPIHGKTYKCYKSPIRSRFCRLKEGEK